MTDSPTQLPASIPDNLLALTESLDQALPTVGARLSQSDIALTPEQFDTLIASW